MNTTDIIKKMRITVALGLEEIRALLRDSYYDAKEGDAARYSTPARLINLHTLHDYSCKSRVIGRGIERFFYRPFGQGQGEEGLSALPHMEDELPHMPLLIWAKPESYTVISRRDVNDARVLYWVYTQKMSAREFERAIKEETLKELAALAHAPCRAHDGR